LLSYLKKSAIPVVISILLTILASLFYLSNNSTAIEIIQRLEAIPYDIRLNLSTPIAPDNIPPIVIVDIDENSLKTQGRWPWSRKKMAQLVEKIYSSAPAVIALDIVQAEAEENLISRLDKELQSVDKKLPDWLNEFKDEVDADSVFANTIKNKEVVLGYPFHKTLLTQSGKLPQTSIVNDINSTDFLTAIHMRGYSANLNSFTNNAAGSGFFSINPDRDGNVRRAPIVAVYNDQIYPSLALEAARLYLLEDTIKLHSEEVGSAKTVTHISLGKTQIPTDAQGQILIPYLGKRHHFNTISANELLQSNKLFTELENAIVLIGTSAIGLADLRPTPLEASFPGVEIQANILHGLLHPETIAYVPDWSEGATVLLLALLCLLMITLYPSLQPLQLIISGIVLLLLTFGLNYWLWAYQQINLPVILSLFLTMSISSVFVIYDLFVENKGRKRIHDMFGQYVPRDHINKLIENPKQITTHGAKREMTVLFSDIRNFTSLSENLTTRELKTFLNQYLTPITKIIFDNQGTIDKYVGDMVMAFWGAPIIDPHHAQQAVKSALEMQNKIDEMQADFSQMGIKNVTAGIGLNTGEMNVGDMGSDYRRAYTVLGDAVNLGARLEGLTKFYGVKILVSEDTKAQCPDIVFRYIDNVRVKGKQDAIKIYEPLMMKDKLTEPLVKQFETHEKSFEYYLQGDWEVASKLFEQQFQEAGGILYQLYIERINSFSGKTPEGWDGVFTHLSK